MCAENREEFMLGKLSVTFLVAACAAAAFQINLIAQQRGQQPANLTEKQWLESKEAQAHVTAAMAIAKPDLLQEAANLCSARGPQRPAVLRQEAGLPAVPRQTLEPTKIFDNLYYIGFNDIGAWALTTSQGIIVIDSLNTPEEAEKILIPGMEKAGLDPKQIKYVIIGHGHFDHFGGTPYLQRTYKPRVLMSGADWDFIAASPQRNRELPVRDVSVTDGQTLTLGDTTLTMLVTPGHTPGSLAILMPVKDRGRQYVAFMPSGGFAAPDRQSLAALEHALEVAKKQKAVALLSGHPGIYGDTLAWMETRRTNPSAPNPFVYGDARFARYLDIADECARGRLAATEQNK
jgi:metallo-beta-lactamase class B